MTLAAAASLLECTLHHHWSTCQREELDHPVSDRSFLQQPWEFPFDQMFTEVPLKKPKVADQEHSKQYARLLSFFYIFKDCQNFKVEFCFEATDILIFGVCHILNAHCALLAQYGSMQLCSLPK